ncbi:flagellar protein FliT [Sulfuriferula sp. AH1]|uniref:flagellar protein FliT n=1 Tax=Sulfuriferula sp. AH1 TaxID=1985873 RepID=UPI000B3B735E|nr:flagellar protein FliT [Sulfuriferula sp. AH1]ARU31514.1 flagellar protein FliT [Sulfuriferula sp. AH1]
MNSEEVISLYESVAQITKQMLAAARQGDWDHLATLESHCADHVHTLQADEAPVKLSDELRSRKMAVIKQILADDREIRHITEPWMTHLSKLINSNQTERKLSIAYGNHQVR